MRDKWGEASTQNINTYLSRYTHNQQPNQDQQMRLPHPTSASLNPQVSDSIDKAVPTAVVKISLRQQPRKAESTVLGDCDY